MNWWGLSILLLGGLAIFLHGMNVMTDGLKAVAGSRLKSFLRSMISCCVSSTDRVLPFS